MAFAVMVTVGSGIHQFSAEIGLNSFICVPGCTCTQFDPAFRKSRLGTAADAAADQDIDPLIIQQSGKGTVPASVGTDDFRADYSKMRSKGKDSSKRTRRR